MKKYIVSIDTLKVEGNQVFKVNAENKADAVKRIKNGEGDIYDQNLEVIDLDYDGISEQDIYQE